MSTSPAPFLSTTSVSQRSASFPWGRILPELPSITIRVTTSARRKPAKRRIATEGWRLRESAGLVWRTLLGA